MYYLIQAFIQYDQVYEVAQETLTHMDFPATHWLKLRTTNVLERLNREIRSERVLSVRSLTATQP